ncbi:MAG: manganese efflux pump [Moorellaceae bacterium]
MSWGMALLLALAVSLDGMGVGFSYGLRGLKLPGVSLFLIALVSTAVSLTSLAFGKLSALLFPPALVQKLGALLLIVLGLEMILETYLKGRFRKKYENAGMLAQGDFGRALRAVDETEPEGGAEGPSPATSHGDQMSNRPGSPPKGEEEPYGSRVSPISSRCYHPGMGNISEGSLQTEGKEREENRILVKVRMPRLGLALAILQEPQRADFDCSGSINPGEALALGLALALDALGTGVGAGAMGFSLAVTPLLIGLSQLLMVAAGIALGRRWPWKKWGQRGSVLPGVILVALGLWRL